MQNCSTESWQTLPQNGGVTTLCIQSDSSCCVYWSIFYHELFCWLLHHGDDVTISWLLDCEEHIRETVGRTEMVECGHWWWSAGLALWVLVSRGETAGTAGRGNILLAGHHWTSVCVDITGFHSIVQVRILNFNYEISTTTNVTGCHYSGLFCAALLSV